MPVATRSIVRLGSRGPDVVQLQNSLNAKLRPSPNLNPDGDFGLRTEQAVRRFQQQNRLTPDGVVGPKTWAALDGGPAGFVGPVMEPRWMAIARREIGVAEVKGQAHNPSIVAYHATTTLKATSDETAWCSSFVNWCLAQAGVAGTNSAAAASWVTWGKETTAQAGAITVIHNPGAANSSLSVSGNHVGFLVEETPTHYKLLGGNQADQVKESSFSKGAWRLKAFRWPAGL